MDGKAISFDGHRDRWARAVSPNPYVPPLTVTAISLQSPCWTHLRYLGNAFLLKTSSPPTFLGFFCLFLNLQTCCYSNPSTLSVLRGTFISSSAAPWKHISPSLLGGWEKMTPPLHVCWSRGSTPAGQRRGGGRWCGGTLSARRSTQKSPCKDQPSTQRLQRSHEQNHWVCRSGGPTLAPCAQHRMNPVRNNSVVCWSFNIWSVTCWMQQDTYHLTFPRTSSRNARCTSATYLEKPLRGPAHPRGQQNDTCADVTQQNHVIVFHAVFE